MSLKEVIKNLKDKSEDDTSIIESKEILNNFIIPSFKNSITYDRYAGYFSSSALEAYWEGLSSFIHRGGEIRLACSHHLLQSDIDSLSNSIDPLYQEKLLIEDFQSFAKKPKNITSSEILSSLIKFKKIKIRIVISKNEKGFPLMNSLFHPKRGFFLDNEKNTVAFFGSANESKSSLYGSTWDEVEYQTSWNNADDVSKKHKRFEKIWSGNHPELISYKLTDQTIGILTKNAVETEDQLIQKIQKIEKEIEKKKIISEEQASEKDVKERNKLYDHQSDVLDNWEKNERNGIIKHATGSGKTYTALHAIEKILNEGKFIPLIIVPGNLLLKQWEDNLIDFFGEKIKILIVNSNNPTWDKNLFRFSKTSQEMGLRIILASDKSAILPRFMDNLHDPNGENLFLIADEVHDLAAYENKNFLEKINPKYRLGLSATPERYMDPEGTNFLLTYFTKILEPEFSLKDALNADPPVLSDYNYDFSEVFFTAEEEEEFILYTKKINKLYARIKQSKDNKDLKIQYKNLLMKRADLSKEANGKINKVYDILNENYDPKKKQFWVVYCNNNDHIDQITERLSNNSKFDTPLIYTSKKINKNSSSLEFFIQNGGILLAVDMLDQGIDIPRIDHAIFIASSRNERQFIQRRGRVLRRHPKKVIANIFDTIVLPSENIVTENPNQNNNEFLGHITMELIRGIEFATSAKNSGIEYILKNIATRYNIDIDQLIIDDDSAINVED